MPKAIVLTQAAFSKISSPLDGRKARAVFFVLTCLVFALVVVYIMQTGDLIKKTFAKTAIESKVAALSQTEDSSKPNIHLSLAVIEQKIAGSGFVPVEQVQYIPLTASLTYTNQLASNLH
ncbi:MAG: hypothetical protein PHU56_02620 [Candidatus Pacebacteria bacterium]|nr:hypothetical protein [Candidatus Paceibacterota bacterium]